MKLNQHTKWGEMSNNLILPWTTQPLTHILLFGTICFDEEKTCQPVTHTASKAASHISYTVRKNLDSCDWGLVALDHNGSHFATIMLYNILTLNDMFCMSNLLFVLFIVSGNGILGKLTKTFRCKRAAITSCWCTSCTVWCSQTNTSVALAHHCFTALLQICDHALVFWQSREGTILWILWVWILWSNNDNNNDSNNNDTPIQRHFCLAQRHLTRM